MTTTTAELETQRPMPRYVKALVGVTMTLVLGAGLYFGAIAPRLDVPEATPAWANQVLPIEDNQATEAVEAGYSVRSVLYLTDVQPSDVAFAVNNLMGTPGLRANDGGNVLLLIVNGQTEQAARAEAQRWQATVQGLLNGWMAM